MGSPSFYMCQIRKIANILLNCSVPKTECPKKTKSTIDVGAVLFSPVW